MPLSTCLQFGDNQIGIYTREYLVTECRYHIFRRYNYYLPDTDARCDKVELVIVAPGKEDLNLYEWFIDQTVLSGRILFDLSNLSPDGSACYKELKFEDAQCFSLSEEYHIDNASRRLLKLEFAAGEVEVDNVVFNHV